MKLKKRSIVDKLNLTDALKKLEEINDWFENREEVDVEQGLEKVKEGVKLVKASQSRLKEIKNEFEEIKKDMAKDGDQANSSNSSEITDEDISNNVQF